MGSYLNFLMFLPDGKHALVCAGKIAMIWDLEGDREVRRFEGHTNSVLSAALSADGKHLLTASDDGTARLWDLATGREIRPFIGHVGAVKSAALSPNGRWVLTGGADTTVRLWDLQTGAELARFTQHQDALVGVAFGLDSSYTLSGSRDGAVKYWSLKKFAADQPYVAPIIEADPLPGVLGELRPAKQYPIGGTLSHLLLSPDRKTLYYLDVANRKVGRLELTSDGRPTEAKVADGTNLLCLSPDGKGLFALAPVHSHRGTNLVRFPSLAALVQVLDPNTLEVRRSFTIAADPHDAVALDNGLLYVAGGSGTWTDLTVVDPSVGRIVASWGPIPSRSFLGMDLGRRLLFAGSSSFHAAALPADKESPASLWAWNVRSSRPVGGSFTASPDGQFVLFKNGTVLRLKENREAELVAFLGPFQAAVIDAESKVVLTLTRNGLLKQFSYTDFKLRTVHRLEVTAYQAVFDPKTGKLFAAVFDPNAALDRPLTQGLGDIYAYDVREVLQGKTVQAVRGIK